MFECKNLRYTNHQQGVIDLEWNHPTYGWIPFSAMHDDVDECGKEIYRAAVSGEYGDIAPFVELHATTKEYRKVVFAQEFRSRFTDSEKLAVKAATYSDPEVGVIYDNFLVMQSINLTDPNVIAAIDLYIDKGLIDPRRKEEILALEEL